MLIKIENGIARISVATDSHPSAITMVDEADLPMVFDGGPKWYAAQTLKSTLYVVRNVWVGEKRVSQRLHRHLMGLANPKILCDHRDHDGLNNTRSNIRVATHGQNMRNRHNQGVTSQYLGVSWCKAANKWISRRTQDKQVRYLGVFDSELDAAHAFDGDAIRCGDTFANLNFPQP